MRNFTPVAFAVILAGCAAVQPATQVSYQSAAERSEHRVETNYVIGTQLEVFVGEQMVRVQDYYVTTRESGSTSARLVPTESFSVKIPPFISASFTVNDTVTVVGTTERGGLSYRLVQLPAPNTQLLRFLIDDDGAFEGSAVNNLGARMGWSYKPEPSSVRLKPAPSTTRIDSTKGFTNFELVYSGTTRESFQLLYREYTQSDLAKPAFSQNLIYDKADNMIRFRNLQIEVHEASNDRIRFTVVSDAPTQ